MTYGYTHAGLEWREKFLWTDEVERPSELRVLLYDDDVDDLSADDDLEDITTEPDDGSYQRANLLLGSGSDVDVQPPDPDAYPETATVLAALTAVEFDVTDTTGEVDSWGAVLDIQLAGDDARREHLIVRAPLKERIELDPWDGIQSLEGAGLESMPHLLTTQN